MVIVIKCWPSMGAIKPKCTGEWVKDSERNNHHWECPGVPRPPRGVLKWGYTALRKNVLMDNKKGFMVAQTFAILQLSRFVICYFPCTGSHQHHCVMCKVQHTLVVWWKCVVCCVCYIFWLCYSEFAELKTELTSTLIAIATLLDTITSQACQDLTKRAACAYMLSCPWGLGKS